MSLCLSLPLTKKLRNLKGESAGKVHGLLDRASHDDMASLVVLAEIAKNSHASNLPGQIKVNELRHQIISALERDEKAVKPALMAKLMAVDWQAAFVCATELSIAFSAAQWAEEEDEDTGRELHYDFLGQNSHLYPQEEQDILCYVARQNPNESLNIQGFAGVGKTAMTLKLAHVFNRKGTYILTQNQKQLRFLQSHVPKQVKVLTVNWFSRFMYGKENIGALWGKRFKTEATSDFANYVKVLHLSPLNGLGEMQVAAILDRCIQRFCLSDDDEIGDQHFPWEAALYLGAADRADASCLPVSLYIKLATSLWEKIIAKDPTSPLNVTPTHLLKYLDLTYANLPSWVGRLIIDESHDLPPVMSKIIKRSNIPVVGLGDHYQITDASPRLSLSQDKIRERYLTLSERSGHNLSETFNEVLNKHKDLPSQEFAGNKKKTTEYSLYERFEPHKVNVVLSNGYWFAFLAIVYLAKNNTPFYVMPETAKKIKQLITAARHLYEKKKPEHSFPELYGYDDWEKLVGQTGALNGLNEIDALFKTGFDAMKISLTLKKASPSTHNKTWVGRVEESKSQEFDEVMLAPDVVDFNNIANAATEAERFQQLNIVYTGLSRAKQHVYLPRQQSEWLVDVGSEQGR